MKRAWIQSIALVAIGSLGSAMAGTVAQRPLFLGGSAEPNIMFLLDSSGSMNNIVPDSPYDSTSVATSCPADNTLSNSDEIQVRIDSSGQSSIQVGSNNYSWGASGLSAKCFDSNLDYQAKLNATDTGSRPWKPGSYLAAEYSGHYLNWYFGATPTLWSTSDQSKPNTESRAKIAKTALISLLPSLDSARVGLATYNGSSGAKIQQAVTPIDGSSIASLTSTINSISFGGMTPLAESLHQIGHYFVGNSGTASGSSSSASCTVNGQYSGNMILHPSSASSAVNSSTLFDTAPAYPGDITAMESPICYFCQKNFAILLTDGRSTADLSIPSVLQDYDGDCSGSNASDCTNADLAVSYDRKVASVYSYEVGNDGTDYLDDVAQALYEIDLRPDINNLNGDASLNNLSTYVIGFADKQVLNDQLLKDTATQGGGEFLTAASAGELANTFRAALNSIAAQVSSGSAIATSSTELNTGLLAFRALFNSGDWTGQLLAHPVASTGDLSASVWDASASTSFPAAGSRNIISWDPSAAAGFDFTTANASTINAIAASAGAPSLSNDVINYLRGDQTNEQPNGTALFRARSRLLGDIINSDPLYVAATNFGFSRLPEGGTSYTSFLDSHASRAKMLYVGANDGMLHGFSINYDAQSNTASGSERFAYIPSAVYDGLASLASPSYSHRFYVDGSPAYSDAYIDPNANAGSKSWNTVLVGTTGAGGSGVFALDITNPTSITASNVLWEINASTHSRYVDLGNTIGQASIARMNNGHFYAVFGNGYGSSSGKAVLYMVRLDDPDPTDLTAVIRRDTQTSANGMSPPLVVDTDGDRIADAIYAGDLQGNLWKVNTSSSNPLDWDFSHSSGSVPLPFFTAFDDNDNVQPITAKPNALNHSGGGQFIVFGTGKFFEEGDDVVVSPQVQTFYGIRDSNNEAVTGLRSDGSFALVEQTIFDEQVVGSFNVRATTKNSVDPSTKKGWYLDLVLQKSGVTPVPKGERVVDNALLRGDRVVFTSITPNGVPCAGGGSSWLMELDAVTGSRLDQTPFDVNRDGNYNSDDYITVTISGETVAIPVSGVQDLSLGITGGAVTVVDASKDEKKLLSGSTGKALVVGESDSSDRGRQSWQQLQ